MDLPLKAEGDVAHDGRTDRQNYDSQDRASIAASRGKNVSEIIPIDLNMSVCVCVCVCVFDSGYDTGDCQYDSSAHSIRYTAELTVRGTSA